MELRGEKTGLLESIRALNVLPSGWVISGDDRLELTINLKDKNDLTPLHKAAYGGHKEIAKLLIDKGADVNAREKLFGLTPLDIAVMEIVIGARPDMKNLKAVAELLRKHGAKK